MVAVGINSCSSSSRFGPTQVQTGHAREIAAWAVEAGDKSSWTGSTPVTKTIGIAVVAAFAASAAGTVVATITAT